MRKLNNLLRKKMRWYREWDDHRFSYHWHWVFLGIFLFGLLIGFILQLWLLPPTKIQAVAKSDGWGCEDRDSECLSGNCLAVCLPDYPITSDLDLNYDCSNGACVGESTKCDGQIIVQVHSSSAGAQSAFDNYGAGASWGYWPSYSETICGVRVESTWSSPYMIYKAVKDNRYFWLSEDDWGEWGCSDDFIKNILAYLMCGQGAAPSGPVCGNGTCESGESCSACESDCLSSGQICCSGGAYSGDCCSDSDCSSGYKCTNHSCVVSSYCGDRTCDSDETCSTCASDCGTCPKAVEETSKPTSLTFGTSGGTQDGGALTYSEGAYTWSVNLPSNFTKVETTHYDKNNPSVIKKYMGWNGYLKVNDQYIWEFNSWSSSTGGLIQDYTLGQEVNESTGAGLWIDATELFHSGANSLTFYHFNEGDGIGTKVRVTTAPSSYCGDSTCDAGETCTSCADDCLSTGQVCCSGTAYTGDCCSDSDCASGKDCSEHTCVSSGPTCGDKNCNYANNEESCSSCPTDCPCSSSECCSSSSSQADYYGCVDSEKTTTSGYICCNGTEYFGDCCSDNNCSSGQICSDHNCVTSGPKCGDGICDSSENCTSCASDCVTSGQVCCEGSVYTGDCCSDSDCASSQRCSSYTCLNISNCGDGTCDSNENCETCQQDCGDCLVEALPVEPASAEPTPAEETVEQEMEQVEEKELKLAFATQKLIEEYNDSGLAARLIQLNEKIKVAEMGDLTVTPLEMHTSLAASVDTLIANQKEDQLVSLLKNAIAAEELALATYEGETEMASLLAESSWQAFRAYLLYKIEAMIAGQLEKLDLAPALELAGQMKESYQNSEDPEEYLKEMGFENLSEINQAIHKTVNGASGSVNKYLENIENQVKRVYVNAYVDMFNKNFKYAIAKQLVYYQVAVKYWITEKGEIPQAVVPYEEYKSAMAAIQNEVREEKQFIAGDNIFARLTSLNNKFKEGADEVDKILEEIGTVAWAIDKGSSLIGKETKFSEAVDGLKKYNADLQSAIDLAAETLGLVGKFAESTYGTYKEAKLYSLFFNAYGKWYDECLGGSATVLEVPLIDKKINSTEVYNALAPLVGAADRIMVQTSETANDLVNSALAVAGAGVEMLKSVGNKVTTTITEGVKKTQKIVVSGIGAASEAAGKAKEVASETVESVKKETGELLNYGKSLVYSVDFSGLWGYLPEEQLPGIIKYAHALQKPNIEVALISPSEVRFLGREREDRAGIDVIVNNPEPGEWTAEIIGKEIEGELPLEITTTVENKELKEFKTEKITEEFQEQSKKSSWIQKNYWWVIIIVVVVIPVIVFILKRKKAV